MIMVMMTMKELLILQWRWNTYQRYSNSKKILRRLYFQGSFLQFVTREKIFKIKKGEKPEFVEPWQKVKEEIKHHRMEGPIRGMKGRLHDSGNRERGMMKGSE